MKKRIPLGISDYEKLKCNDYYFVDKSLLIKEYLDSGIEAVLITRPRRFGKTMTLSMMASFFDITKNSKELFKDTQIMKTEYAEVLNQYPTIFISFAGAKGNIDNIVRQIKNQLCNEYRRFAYIFTDLDEFDNDDYKSIKEDLMETDNGKIEASVDALSFLMKILEKYYGKKVMVFIDEYDTPFVEAYVGGFYEEIKDGLLNMLHNALKTSTSLQYAMLTGTHSISNDDIFGGLNNLVVCNVKDKEYSKYFGFTEKETKEILDYYGLELNEEVKEMYNGYKFGDCEIYNPWSILNYVDTRKLNLYWVNASSNKIIRKALEHRSISFDRDYEKLIKTGKLETLVRMNIRFYENNSISNIWGLLVNAGYLTISEVISFMNERYVLKIPNKEAQKELQKFIEYYQKEVAIR